MIRQTTLHLLSAGILLLVGCGEKSQQKIVVYSPHGKELLADFAQRFEASHPGVKVQWLDMGAQDALDRVRSERANPQADVWFGGPTTIFQRGAAESLLADYRPSWAASVPKTGGDQYFPVYRTPAIIAYNSAAVSANDAPKDWDDVLAPRWHDRVLIRDPVASGTMRAIWGLIIERSIRDPMPK